MPPLVSFYRGWVISYITPMVMLLVGTTPRRMGLESLRVHALLDLHLVVQFQVLQSLLDVCCQVRGHGASTCTERSMERVSASPDRILGRIRVPNMFQLSYGTVPRIRQRDLLGYRHRLLSTWGCWDRVGGGDVRFVRLRFWVSLFLLGR